jgi:hypothetical protein
LVRDGLTRHHASAVAAWWVDWREAEEALGEAQRHRREGRGRRPSGAMIARLQKRVGLAWSSYDAALKRLEELAGQRGGVDLPTALRRLKDGLA